MPSLKSSLPSTWPCVAFLLIVAALWGSDRAQAQARSAPPQCTLSREPTAVIGDAGTELGAVTGGVFVEDTLLAVTDHRDTSLRFFSVSGRQVARYGRRGSGPGEFQRPEAVTTWGDTAVVFDPSERRVSYFTVKDGHIRTMSTGWGFRSVLPGGRLLYASNTGIPNETVPRLVHDTIEVWLLEPTGTPRQLLLELGAVRIADMSMGLSILVAPFSPRGQVEASRDRIVVGVGQSDILRFTSDGRRLSPFRVPFPARRLTRSDLTQWIDHELARATPDRRPALRRLYVVAVLPPVAPAHGWLAVDRRSVIWVQEYRTRYDTRPAEIVAADEQNRIILRAAVPANYRVLAASPTHAAFVATNRETDEERVIVFAVSCGA